MKRRSTRSILLSVGTALLIAQLAVARSNPITMKPLDHAASLAEFGRIKKLEGVWRSRSTKGWEENQQFHLIAKGTAIVSESVPGADLSNAATAPNGPMLTVYYMDGDRLELTHYCEAGNQPRMIASSIDDGGHTVHFSFLDATNLPSVSTGHMHSVAMTFIDDNHFSERWSWFQNDEEQWMETIQNERVTASNQQP